MRPQQNNTSSADQWRLTFWQGQFQEAKDKPWLACLLLRQAQRIQRQLRQIAAHLKTLPERWRRPLTRKLAPGLAGAAMLLAFAGASSAAPDAANAVIVVDDSCTLANAINSANRDTATGGCTKGSGADTIRLQVDVNLTEALPPITSVVTIEGGGHTIQRTGQTQFSVLHLQSGALTLDDATISGGNAGTDRSGGGIYAEGGSNLTISGSTISGNSAGAGGGVYSGTNATMIVDSVFSGNTASGFGGAVAGYSYTVINQSTISGNTAVDGGGTALGSMHFINYSTISDNTASDSGGGILNHGGILNLMNSTVSGNVADQGGGIYDYGDQSTITSSTISNNYASTSGGGWEGSPTGFTLSLNHSIVSGNNSGGGGPEIDAKTCSQCDLFGTTGNVVGYGGSSRSVGLSATFESRNVIPQGSLLTVLGPLSDNGGPTETHALVRGSPAIDVAPNSQSGLFDQRGMDRDVNSDGVLTSTEGDAGSYEFQEVGAAAPLFSSFLPFLPRTSG